jgi:hypothetical protein
METVGSEIGRHLRAVVVPRPDPDQSRSLATPVVVYSSFGTILKTGRTFETIVLTNVVSNAVRMQSVSGD